MSDDFDVNENTRVILDGIDRYDRALKFARKAIFLLICTNFVTGMAWITTYMVMR